MKSTTQISNSAGRGYWKRSSRRWVSLAAFLLATPLLAQEWTPSEQLLNLVRKIESANGVRLVGDHGNSLGAYQMSAGAWNDVSAWRHARNLQRYAYAPAVWDESVSRAYAANYLQMLHERLARNMGRTPTCGEVYAAYNMGFTAFAHCRFSLAHVNSVTAGNCHFIDDSLSQLAAANSQDNVTLASK